MTSGEGEKKRLSVCFLNSVLSACMFFKFKNHEEALTGVAQWIEYRTVNQRVTGSIPSQGTCLGGRPRPPVGGV